MAVVTALGFSWQDPALEEAWSLDAPVNFSDVDQLLMNPIFVNQAPAPATSEFPMEPGWRKVVRRIG
jgi:hypothetical protein